MILHDVTMRNYAHYQALLGRYDDSEFDVPGDGDEAETEFAPLIRAAALVRAARDAGVADALPESLSSGDPMALPPTQANREALYETGAAIAQHIMAATANNQGE